MTATGSNNISLIYESSNSEQYDFRPLNSVFCKINKELVNTIFTKMRLNELYSDSFIKKYFDIYPKIQWNDLSDRYMIILDKYKCGITPAEETEIKSLNVLDNISIYDCRFRVIIKCKDYDNIKKIYYDTNKYDNLREIFIESNLRNIYYFDNECIEIISKIYDDIIIFFNTKYKIHKKDIIIKIPILDLNNLWVDIQIEFSKIYSNYFLSERITKSHSMVRLDDLLRIYKYGNISDIINDNYHVSINSETIEKYGIGEYCYGMQFTKNKVKNMENNEMDYYRKFYDNYPIKNKYDIKYYFRNTNIVRILSHKNTYNNSLCSISVCVNDNNKYYVINILPRTISYMFSLKNTKNTEQIYNYLIDSVYREKYEDFDKKIIYVNHHNLKYIIEKIKIDPYNCTGCNIAKRINNEYINTLLMVIKKIYYINTIENYDISQILTDCYKKNFNINMHILIYNIIRNILICANKGIIQMDDVKEYFKRIIKLEEKINGIDNQIYFGKILNDNYGDILVLDGYNFICIPSRSSFTKKKYREKILIWYATPNIYEKNKIIAALDNIELFCNSFNSKDILFSQIEIDKYTFSKIYELTEIEIEELINEYLYNASSLFIKNNNSSRITNHLPKV